MTKRNSWPFVLIFVLISVFAYIARAGTLEFDGVPVDITTSTNEDLVIVPGSGGNVQIGDESGTNSNATSNDDLHITGNLEVDGACYFDSTATVSGTLTAGSVTSSGAVITTGISDADGDTKVQVEESADEDIIRFDTAGNQVASIDATGDAIFQTSTDSTTGFQVLDADGGTPILNIDTTNERVGIGTADPAYDLDVAGDINLTGTLYDDGSPFVTGYWTETGDDIYYNTGNVGIGTTEPANILEVDHTGADADDGVMIVRADTSTADGNLLGGIGFDSTDGNVPSSITEASAFIAAYAAEDHGTTDKGADLVFGTSLIDEDDDTTSTEHMRILDSGDVGIGTTAPGQLLEVFTSTDDAGRIRITETATAGGYSGLEFYGRDGTAGNFGGAI
ncbi:MAG: hypothetical protein JSV93_00610, partial [Candidatus Omnitrophota bacterium]